jgi:hypothetical protein
MVLNKNLKMFKHLKVFVKIAHFRTFKMLKKSLVFKPLPIYRESCTSNNDVIIHLLIKIEVGSWFDDTKLMKKLCKLIGKLFLTYHFPV